MLITFFKITVTIQGAVGNQRRQQTCGEQEGTGEDRNVVGGIAEETFASGGREREEQYQHEET